MKRLKENIPYGDTISTKHKNDHKAMYYNRRNLHCVSIVVVLRARQTTRWTVRPGRALGTYIIKTVRANCTL